MSSPVIAGRQLTLPLHEELLMAHRTVRDVIAAGIYRRGLKAMASDLELTSGNLSVALSDDDHRKFSVDEMERYIQVTGDKSPIYYLVAKYLGDQAAVRDQALHQVAETMQQMLAAFAAAGLPTTVAGNAEGKGRRR